MIRDLVRPSADAIAPRPCAGCEVLLPVGHPTNWCDTCCATLLPPAPPWCPRCGLPLANAASCPDCARSLPAFALARAATVIGGTRPGAVEAAVRRFKYGGQWQLARPLAALLAARYPFDPLIPILAIPAHPTRVRDRGLDHTHLLVRHLARLRGLTVMTRALVRVTATAPQAGRSARERVRMAQPFRLRRTQAVTGRHVVLLDDVLTTGATASAAAAILYAAGAAHVAVFTIGRTRLRPLEGGTPPR